jgi:hypothetical protein
MSFVTLGGGHGCCFEAVSVMTQLANHGLFQELSAAEQHTVETYIDELSRRDTLVDHVLARSLHDADDAEGDEPRDSRIYAIPSADSDRRGALAVLRACE